MGFREDFKSEIIRATRLFLGNAGGNMGTEVTATAAELNIMDGVTSTATELNLLDGTTVGVGVVNKAVAFGPATKLLDVGVALGGAAAVGGIILGGGTSASPIATAVADQEFMEFRAKSTAATGDNRFLYIRYEAGGAANYDAIRAFTKVTAATATCRGAHISLDIAATFGCSGLGVAMDAQVLAGDGAITGGTIAALNLEWYAAGSSTDVSGTTQNAFIRMVLGGDATGAANIEDDAFALVITGGSNASGNIVGGVVASPTLTNAYPIRVSLNGTTTYLVAATVS